MLGFLIDLSREQLLELVRIILEEVPWDLNTRRAIRIYCTIFISAKGNAAAFGSRTTPSGCFCVSRPR